MNRWREDREWLLEKVKPFSIPCKPFFVSTFWVLLNSALFILSLLEACFVYVKVITSIILNNLTGDFIAHSFNSAIF